MKMRIVFLGSVLLFSSALQAGVYLGTNATVPANQTTLEMLSPNPIQPPLSVPYFSADTVTVKSEAPIDCESYTGKGPIPPMACATEVTTAAVVVEEPLSVTVRDGSLRANIDRITNQAGWERMVWDPEYDYNWVGNVTITASDIQGIMTKLLEPYPLQAVFYTANHVVEIVPRRNT